MKQVILVKYGELFLRKGNRHLYEQHLMNALRRHLSPFGGSAIHVVREQGRLLIEDMRGDINPDIMPKIRSIFGIAAVCLCVVPEENAPEKLQEAAYQFMLTRYAEKSSVVKPLRFKVETRRADKRYPMPSQAVSAAVGGYLQAHMPWLKVDLHTPDVTLFIEIRTRTYLYTQWEPGESGLPYGTSGKGVLLLSGGIDSPVAGYLMARRGVAITPVYFHAPPYTSERAKDKVKDLVQRLTNYTEYTKLYVISFTEIQLYLYEHVQHEKLTLLLKRAMLRIAEQIAHMEKAHCLITGDSVAQVASQTLHGLAAVQSASSLPVLRPLAGMDKQEIINKAREIETYSISIRPYDDCCTLFVADHPENKPNTAAIEKIEARLTELPALCENALKSAEIFTFKNE